MTKNKDNVTTTPEIVEKVTLPVGVAINGKRHVNVELRPVTLGASYEAQMTARETDLIALIDLATMIHVPELGRTLSYDETHGMSRQDSHKIDHHRVLLEKKERDVASAQG